MINSISISTSRPLPPTSCLESPILARTAQFSDIHYIRYPVKGVYQVDTNIIAVLMLEIYFGTNTQFNIVFLIY